VINAGCRSVVPTRRHPHRVSRVAPTFLRPRTTNRSSDAVNVACKAEERGAATAGFRCARASWGCDAPGVVIL
jgi:hypothetical protein